MNREADLEILDKSDEERQCPTHPGYTGKEGRPDFRNCIGCWNIYIWQLALEQIQDD